MDTLHSEVLVPPMDYGIGRRMDGRGIVLRLDASVGRTREVWKHFFVSCACFFLTRKVFGDADFKRSINLVLAHTFHFCSQNLLNVSASRVMSSRAFHMV